MKTKIQFEILELEVNRQFDESLNLKNDNEISEKLNLIREFIESCGWTYDDYTARQWGWSLLN
jgi:hypothetical protein